MSLDRYREDDEDDTWSVDSSRTDTSSIVYSPHRHVSSSPSSVTMNADLIKRLAKGKGKGPQLLRQAQNLGPKTPLAVAETVVVLPPQMRIPLPKGVTFDQQSMSFQGLEEVDMSGFDDSDDEGEAQETTTQTPERRDSKGRDKGVPVLTRTKTPPPPLRPPTPTASTVTDTNPHNRRSSMSEFVIDEAMREALFESQRRHNVMLLALVGFETYGHIQTNGRRLLNEKFATNVQASRQPEASRV